MSTAAKTVGDHCHDTKPLVLSDDEDKYLSDPFNDPLSRGSTVLYDPALPSSKGTQNFDSDHSASTPVNSSNRHVPFKHNVASVQRPSVYFPQQSHPYTSLSDQASVSNSNQSMATPTLAYDAERAQTSSSHGADKRPPLASRQSSGWGVLDGIKKLEHSYDEFDTRHASKDHLVYAEGDMPKNKVSKMYLFLLNASIVTRWILFIVPVLGLIWIPGILAVTSFPNAKVWSTGLLWWSIWLTVAWAGWWAALAASRIAPAVIRATLGVVAVGTRRYIEWMAALHRYIALFAWSLVIWIAWKPLIKGQQVNPGQKSTSAVDLIEKLLFAIFLCSAVLLFEKFAIQLIAGKFHERSYAERIADQKYAVRALVTLYRHSSDIPGRTLDSPTAEGKQTLVNPKFIFKKITKGVKKAATTTTTALGNVASEIAGSSVLQPNSPQAIIKTTLESSNKSRQLARRIFYSFAKRGAEYMLVEDIARFFPTHEEALQVFSLFDKDGNGDASLEEVEMSMMDFHREQLSIENSMRDLDSAVGRLDNIFMSLYVVIAGLILAVALEAQLLTLITGAGTLILGLSWLIGGSLQEVLASIIFLFIKHPFDVGDRVVINNQTYTVKEIRLLSTVFLDANSTSVQAPNNALNTLFIQNLRRSPQMSETFTFDVSYGTSFEDLEKLREVMLKFLTEQRRDYHAVFDVNILNFPDQDKLQLSVDIKYKSNAQLGSLKAKRRNKWICALKSSLAECKIYGPKGDPDSAPGVTRYTEVPWDIILAEDRKAAWEKAQLAQQQAANPEPIKGSWNLSDKNAVIADTALDDVFGDKVILTPEREHPPAGLPTQASVRPPANYPGMPAPSFSMPMPSSSQRRDQSDVIEMQPPRRG